MNNTQMTTLKLNPNPLASLRLWLGVGLLSAAFAANARDYKVEVILFENTNSSMVTESHDYEPPKRMTSGSKTWKLAPSMLTTEAEKLGKSSNYEIKHHYAWGVESLRYQDSANYNIVDRDTQGFIKVYADQLLFTNIDLDYKGFRMQEKRRLKLNEKHFFDHPKFGLLMRVSRLEPKKDEAKVANSKPAEVNKPDKKTETVNLNSSR